METTIEEHELIDQYTDILDKKQSDPEMPYWIHSEYEEQGGYGEGESLCYDCIKKIFPDGEIGDHFGGGYCCEEDGCEHCEVCGKLLHYTLTDYGLRSELEHFTEYPPENLDDADECYHLARIAHALWTDEQKQQFLSIMRHISIS